MWLTDEYATRPLHVGLHHRDDGSVHDPDDREDADRVAKYATPRGTGRD
jgi:hypothetical protein